MLLTQAVRFTILAFDQSGFGAAESKEGAIKVAIRIAKMTKVVRRKVLLTLNRPTLQSGQGWGVGLSKGIFGLGEGSIGALRERRDNFLDGRMLVFTNRREMPPTLAEVHRKREEGGIHDGMVDAWRFVAECGCVPSRLPLQ